MSWFKKLLDKMSPGQKPLRDKPLRGRLHEDVTAGNEAPGKAKTRPKGRISARVFRASTGRWEDLGVIAVAEVSAPASST